MALLELIELKRDGHALSAEQWSLLASAVQDKRLPTYQLAAFNVAVAINGTTAEERGALYGILAAEGIAPDVLELSNIGVDKSLYGGQPPEATRSSHAIIHRKLQGEALDEGAIRQFIAGVTDGSVRDEEIAAFCMAVYLRGMERAEVVALTRAMTQSGEVLHWDGLPGPAVDKHSTGGVGDKVSLPMAGVLAACGAYVPMISGRGLGHTGGTLDKLQAIPGYRIDLSPDEVQAQVRSVRAVITGQTGTIAPSDKRIYAIRDVTGTVSSIPLITASILSKKLAEGISSLVLDVKVGSGGFMKTLADARALALSLVEVGRDAGVKMTALLTAMDQPLGLAVGNANEVAESVACLRGDGPKDLEAIVVAMSAELLVSSGLAPDVASGERAASQSISDGRALAAFRSMVAAQGGDVGVIDAPERLPAARLVKGVTAPRAGFLQGLDALSFGRALIALGGGRRVQEDKVDPAVGILLRKKVGQRVEAGETLLDIHANARERLLEAEKLIVGAIRIGTDEPAPERLVLERL